MRSTNSGLVVGAVTLILAAALAGCSEVAEPPAISDQERERLTEVVENASWIEDAVCSVEVFRQDGPVTYGWSECTNALSAGEDQIEQSDSSPFRAEGGTVQVPAGGSQYAEDIRSLFPEDLVSTIEQYSGINSAPVTGE